MREVLRRSTATLVRYGRAVDRRVSGRALLRLHRNRTPDDLAGRRLLFLCEGNVCRSPLAAALARKLLTMAARVDSAGLGNAAGRTPPPLALEVAAGMGLDLGAHRSAPVTPEQVREADCVFVMDRLNVLRAWRRFPEARRKLFLLDAPREVRDPYGEAEPVFWSAFEQIRAAVERLAVRPAGAATVVVADAERNTSLCVARSLGRAGHRVVAVASEDVSGGGALRSSSVARVERAPADPGAYADAVVSLARRVGAVAIFAHYERTLLELHRRAGPPPPVIAGAAPAQLELCAHKSRVLEAARRAGVPVPDTRIVDAGTSEADLAREVRSLAAAHGWPLYAKVDSELGVPPGRDHRYLVLDGDADLPRLAAFVRARGMVLLQERVAGQGCGVAGVFVRGAPACVGGHVRLREAQASGGVSTFCESRVVDEALRSATALLTALEWTGVAMVEFKLPPGRPPVLMEVNPRLWGTLPLYVRAGADVPLAALELALHGRVPPGRPYEEGRRLRFLLPDLVAIREQRRGLRRLVALARAVAETPWIVPEATFSFRDPLPFLVDVADQASESLRRRLGRLVR